jgi:ribosomal protein L24E
MRTSEFNQLASVSTCTYAVRPRRVKWIDSEREDNAANVT